MVMVRLMDGDSMTDAAKKAAGDAAKDAAQNQAQMAAQMAADDTTKSWRETVKPQNALFIMYIAISTIGILLGL